MTPGLEIIQYETFRQNKQSEKAKIAALWHRTQP